MCNAPKAFQSLKTTFGHDVLKFNSNKLNGMGMDNIFLFEFVAFFSMVVNLLFYSNMPT